MRELPEAGEAAQETVAGAATTATHLPAAEARTLLETAFDAYSTGVSTAALTGAAVLAAVTLLVRARPSSRRRGRVLCGAP